MKKFISLCCLFSLVAALGEIIIIRQFYLILEKDISYTLNFHPDNCNINCLKLGIAEALNSYQEKISHGQNWIMIWGGMLTIVFLLFSILGLYKIDKNLQDSKDRAEEMEIKSLKFWEHLFSILIIEKSTSGAFFESACKTLASDESKEAEFFKKFSSMFSGFNYFKEGEFEKAIKHFDVSIEELRKSRKKEESNKNTFSPEIYTISYWKISSLIYIAKNKKSKIEKGKTDNKNSRVRNEYICNIKEILIISDKLIKECSDGSHNRFESFIHYMKGRAYLLNEDYKSALKECDIIENLYPQAGSSHDLRGDIYRKMWKKTNNTDYYKKSVNSYMSAINSPYRQKHGVLETKSKLRRNYSDRRKHTLKG